MGLYDDLVNTAKLYACDLYNVLPDAMTGTPYARTKDWMLNELCAPPSSPSLPPPAISQFSGGQCSCIKYRVIYNLIERFQGQEFVTPTGVSLNGEITSVRIINDGSQSSVEFLCRGTGALPCTPDLVWVSAYNTPSRPGYEISKIAVQSVVRQDGQVDNCGDPPPSHPPVAQFPPEGMKSPPTIININGIGNFNFYFIVHPPAVLPPAPVPDRIPPLVVDISDVGDNFKIPVTFNFDGSVDFGGGEGGLPPDFIDKIDGLGSGIGSVGSGLAGLASNIDFNFSPPDFLTAPEVEKKEKQVDTGGDKEEDEKGLLGVLVELTTLPEKIQFGTPNVNFAGWLTFLVQGGYAPRNPIAFDKGYFPAPSGATGYALTFTNGAKGKITVFSKVDENDGEIT